MRLRRTVEEMQVVVEELVPDQWVVEHGLEDAAHEAGAAEVHDSLQAVHRAAQRLRVAIDRQVEVTGGPSFELCSVRDAVFGFGDETRGHTREPDAVQVEVVGVVTAQEAEKQPVVRVDGKNVACLARVLVCVVLVAPQIGTLETHEHQVEVGRGARGAAERFFLVLVDRAAQHAQPVFFQSEHHVLQEQWVYGDGDGYRLLVRVHDRLVGLAFEQQLQVRAGLNIAIVVGRRRVLLDGRGCCGVIGAWGRVGAVSGRETGW